MLEEASYKHTAHDEFEHAPDLDSRVHRAACAGQFTSSHAQKMEPIEGQSDCVGF